MRWHWTDLYFNEDNTLKKEYRMAPKRTKKTFYVGSPTVPTSWLHDNVDDAIEQAKEMCKKDGLTRPVVQIVKVIERSIPPVTVRNPR